MPFELLSLQTIEEFAKHYGYWTVLLGIMLENAGIPLPGETIVIVGGFLAGSGELSIWLVFAVTIVGAIVGDSIGYWIGSYGGWPLLLTLGKLFRIPESKLVELKQRFSYNAARAVFWGRFVTILRIFAGPMAGVAEMPYGRFLIYNTAGATLWAGVIVTASFFAGQVISLERLVTLVGQFGSLVVLVVVAIFLGIYAWEHREQVGSIIKAINKRFATNNQSEN